LQTPVPLRGEDGKVRRVFFSDDPKAWVRGLPRILRSQLVAEVVRDDERAELTRDEVAALISIRRNTWSSYVARGQAPAPSRYVGRTPVWTRTAVDAWQASRRGRGHHRVSVS